MFESGFNRKGFAEFKGKKDGPTTLILGGVHGDEKPGITALKLLHASLRETGINAGRVILGWGNPEAIAIGQRFVEADLNRVFKPDEFLTDQQRGSLEYQRAQVMKPYLNQADAVLDIHGTSNLLGVPFVLGEPNSYQISQYFPVDVRFSGIDALQPGGTDWYMNQVVGKPGICLEPGYNNNPASVTIAELSSYALLTTMGHLSEELTTRQQKTFIAAELYTIKTDAYALCRRFRDFEDIKPGQAIAIDGTEIIEAKKPGVIVFASRMALINRQGTGTFFIAREAA